VKFDLLTADLHYCKEPFLVCSSSFQPPTLQHSQPPRALFRQTGTTPVNQQSRGQRDGAYSPEMSRSSPCCHEKSARQEDFLAPFLSHYQWPGPASRPLLRDSSQNPKIPPKLGQPPLEDERHSQQICTHACQWTLRVPTGHPGSCDETDSKIGQFILPEIAKADKERLTVNNEPFVPVQGSS